MPSQSLKTAGCLGQVVLMDHMDWLDSEAAQVVAQELAAAVPQGGRIIWRSAALSPPYNQYIASAGFLVTSSALMLPAALMQEALLCWATSSCPSCPVELQNYS